MSRMWDNPAPQQAQHRGAFDAAFTPLRDRASATETAALGAGTWAEALQHYGPLGARLLMSQIFLLSGVMKIADWSGTEAEMAGRGMFWIPFFLAAATLVELGAGLSLLLGYWARLGALTLFLYLIPVTLTFHNFWTYPPDQQKVQMLFLLHNLALMGGLLLLTACGAGPLSLDRKARRS